MSKSILVGLMLLPLAACSGKNATPDVAAVPPVGTTTPMYEPTPAPQPVQDEDHVSVTNPSDIAFLDQMIPHHEQAIEMAKLAQQRGEHAEIRELAADIVSSQQEEIEKMQAWKKEWAGGEKPEQDPTDTTMGLDATDDLADHREVAGTTPHAPGVAPADATGPHEDPTAPHDLAGPQDDLANPQDPLTGRTDPLAGAQEDPTDSLSDDVAQDDVAQDDVAAKDSTGPAPKDFGGDMPKHEEDGDDDDDDKDTLASSPSPTDDPTATPQDGMTDPKHADVSKEHEALASAEEFDQAFLDAMIEHHQAGIDMARAASPRLEHSEAKALADGIIAEQSEEIAKMKEWRDTWFKTDTAPAI